MSFGRCAREELPSFIQPMLLHSNCSELPRGDDWAFEVKWDGMRTMAVIDDGRVRLRSRRGRDCSDEFPELGVLGEVMPRRQVVLDGELVVLAADGKPNFQLLRARLGRPASARVERWRS